MYRKGQYAALIGEYERESEPWENALDATKAHYHVAMAHYRLGHRVPAVHAMEKALQEVHGCADWLWIGRVRYQAGEVLRWAGEVGEARDWTERFLSDLDKYPEHEAFRGPAHYQLGLILRMRQDTVGSIQEYREAVGLLRSGGQTFHLVMALENLCWVLTEDGQTAPASKCIEEIEFRLEALGESTGVGELRVSYLCNRAFFAQKNGHVHLALELVNEVVLEGSTATPAQKGFATWISAECAIDTGDPASAIKLLAMADSYATQAVDSRLINYISASRRRLTSLGIQPA